MLCSLNSITKHTVMTFWWLRTKILVLMVIMSGCSLTAVIFVNPQPCIRSQPQSGSKSRFKKWHHISGWCKAQRPQLFLQPQTDLMRNAVFTTVRPQKQWHYEPIVGLTPEMLKSVRLFPSAGRKRNHHWISLRRQRQRLPQYFCL